jgi:hypothetical protein
MLIVLLYSILTLQIVYSVELNCTESNYAEGAGTYSAEQQHRNCQLMSSEVDCSRLFGIVCVYRESHFKRLYPSNSFYLLQSWSRNFCCDKEQVDVTRITDTVCKLKTNSNIIILKCRFM